MWTHFTCFNRIYVLEDLSLSILGLQIKYDVMSNDIGRSSHSKFSDAFRNQANQNIGHVTKAILHPTRWQLTCISNISSIKFCGNGMLPPSLCRTKTNSWLIIVSGRNTDLTLNVRFSVAGECKETKLLHIKYVLFISWENNCFNTFTNTVPCDF